MAAVCLHDETLNEAVDGEIVLSGEGEHPVEDGDAVEVIRTVTGG